MTRDIHVLRLWLMVVATIAALMASAVPVLYARYRWRQFKAGRIFMFQCVSIAIGLDTTILFQFWQPDILIIFWIQAIVFTMLAISSTLTVVMLTKINQATMLTMVNRFLPRKGKK